VKNRIALVGALALVVGFATGPRASGDCPDLANTIPAGATMPAGHMLTKIRETADAWLKKPAPECDVECRMRWTAVKFWAMGAVQHSRTCKAPDFDTCAKYAAKVFEAWKYGNGTSNLADPMADPPDDVVRCFQNLDHID
jgi:hypothetical protein